MPPHAKGREYQESTRTMDGPSISDREFFRFQELIHGITGIYLAPVKKTLLCGRLSKRLRSHDMASYAQYFDLVTSGRDAGELEVCVNLLTTNETYFFREPRHFDVLREHIAAARRAGTPLRAWSAACSSGEEPYTIAMVLAEALGDTGMWEVLGSDISSAVLEKAARALYSLERARHIPERYLKKYCLKGVGAHDGMLLVDAPIRKRVRFARINLNETLPQVGEFDVIFLRNVLIYFQLDIKQQVVARLANRLKPGGWFIIGHSESLNGVNDTLRPILPTVYRKPGSA